MSAKYISLSIDRLADLNFAISIEYKVDPGYKTWAKAENPRIFFEYCFGSKLEILDFFDKRFTSRKILAQVNFLVKFTVFFQQIPS